MSVFAPGFRPGWHGSRATAHQHTEARAAAPAGDSIEVVMSRSTTIRGQGESRAYGRGERAYLPASLARSMFAAGSIACADRTEPDRRGWTRITTPDGRERRLCNGEGVMSVG
jgi:hypothetical protein